MDVNIDVKANLRIRAFYLFFVISGIQIGVGIMGAPSYIFKEARQDSWISIIIAYSFILIVLYAMVQILKTYENADIFGIQVDLFGKWLGKLLGTVYIIHFSVALLTILITYIEVVQIFIFPELSSLVLGMLLISLVIYSVLGGLRVIIGVTFLFFFLAFWLIPLLYDPLTRMDMSHFRPVFNTPIIDLLKGAKQSTFTFTGFEILFLIYPFIQNKKQIKRPVFLGASFSAFLVLLTTVIAIGYFSPGQLKKMEWSVLSLYKIVKLPFIARFDYIVVAEWMMVILPNLLLLMWAVTYGLKRIYKVPQKVTLYVVSVLLLVMCMVLDRHSYIIKLTTNFSKVSFWLIYVYPLLLLPIVLLKSRMRKRKKERAN